MLTPAYPDQNVQLPSRGPPRDITFEELSITHALGQILAGDLQVKYFPLLIPSSHEGLSLTM